MKKRFFIQAGLTTMLFFLFLNLFGSPFSSVTSRSPEIGELDHEWAITPKGVIAVRGTYTEVVVGVTWITHYCPPGYLFDCSIKTCVPENQVDVMKKYSKHLRSLLNYGVCHPDTSPYYNY